MVEAAWNDGHRFSGRVALVTGAGGTLGGAVARGFGGEGASVLVGYRGSREAAESVAGDVVAGGGVASAFQLDVTDQASVDRFVEQADALYGRIDVLVNAAGRLEEADTVRFEHMSADAATYYSRCFSVGDRAAAQRGAWLRGTGYVVSPPFGRYGSGGEGLEAGAVVVPAGAGLVAASPV